MRASHDSFTLIPTRLQMAMMLAISGIIMTPKALADESKANQTRLDKVTVTAQKSEETLIKVPQSITVLTGEELESQALDTLQDIAKRVPSMMLPSTGLTGLNPASMRGINAGVVSFSTALPMYIDGIPILNPVGYESTLIDIEQMEVLRGPQGSLYGRNAEVGAINITSRKPDNDVRAGVLVEVGERNKRKLQVKGSAPLVKDTLYFSIAGDTTSQDGFIDNTFKNEKANDTRQDNARAQLRWTPTPKTDIMLTGNYLKHDDGGQSTGLPTQPKHEVRSNEDTYNRSKATSYALNIAHQFENDLKLTAITAQRSWQDDVNSDFDLTEMPMVRFDKYHQFNRLSQEVRLENTLGEHNWMAGIYADQDDNKLRFDRYTGMGTFKSHSDQDGHVEAVFTHWNFKLSEPLNLQVGARYEQNSQTLKNKQTQKKYDGDWSHTSPKLSLSYEQGASTTYVTVAEGFRAGGFNAFSPAGKEEYDEETLWSYEIGSKASLFNNVLDVSAALYYMDINDMQVQENTDSSNVFISNAAKATSYGAEVEFKAFLDNWMLFGHAAFNESKFDQFKDSLGDYKGNTTPYAPKHTFNLGVRYDSPQNWYGQAEVQGVGEYYLAKSNDHKQSAYQLVNMMVGYEYKQWNGALYAKNLFDTEYDIKGYFNGTRTIYNPPREVGLRLSYNL